MTDNIAVDCWGEPIPAPPHPQETVEENSPVEQETTVEKEQSKDTSNNTRTFTEQLKELDPSRAKSQELTPEQIRINFEKSRAQVMKRQQQEEIAANESKTEQETTKLPAISEDKPAIANNVLDVDPKDPQEVLARVIDTVGHDATCMQREPELTAAVLMLAQALNNISSEQLSHDGTVEKALSSKTSERSEKKKKTPLKKRVVSILFYGLLTCLLTAAILLILAAVGFEPALAVFGLSS